MEKNKPLRILVTADPELPVPPIGYGGIERIIAGLVDGLVSRGHEVALLAHADSKTRGTLIPYPALQSRSVESLCRNAAALTRTWAVWRPGIVHSFGRLAYMVPVLPFPVPKLMSYQRPVTRSRVAWARRLARGTLAFSGCSESLVRPVRDVASWYVVHNSVSIAKFNFADHVGPDAPLVFLGRIEHLKGAHLAIEIARRSGRRLVMAGNVADEHRGYFEREIAPRIDGETVTYLGELDDEGKSRMLAAAALLMPVLWEEPFGIVMAEALACGTPVIGLSRGAVPEVIEDGRTGFVCDTVDEMVDAVGRLDLIDRNSCRRIAEQKYSTDAMVEAYGVVYADLIGVPSVSEPVPPPSSARSG